MAAAYEKLGEKAVSTSAAISHLTNAYGAYETAFIILSRPSPADVAWQYLIRPFTKDRLLPLISESTSSDQLNPEERTRAIQVSSQLSNVARAILEQIGNSDDGKFDKTMFVDLQYHHSFWALAAMRQSASTRSPGMTGSPAQTIEYLDVSSYLRGADHTEGFLLERCATASASRGRRGDIELVYKACERIRYLTVQSSVALHLYEQSIRALGSPGLSGGSTAFESFARLSPDVAWKGRDICSFL
jgi:hypothetical protein